MPRPSHLIAWVVTTSVVTALASGTLAFAHPGELTVAWGSGIQGGAPSPEAAPAPPPDDATPPPYDAPKTPVHDAPTPTPPPARSSTDTGGPPPVPTLIAPESGWEHPPRTTESYGGQIVSADVGGLILCAVVGNLAGSSTNALIVVAPYLLASPLVHVAHGNPGRAGLAILLHVASPIAGALLGLLIDSSTCNGDSFCGVGGAAIGLLGGMVAATVVDATVLAHDVPIATSPPSVRRAGLVPVFSAARNGSVANAGVGIVGRF